MSAGAADDLAVELVELLPNTLAGARLADRLAKVAVEWFAENGAHRCGDCEISGCTRGHWPATGSEVPC